MSGIIPLWNEELCFKYATKFLINPCLRNAEVQRNVMRRFVDFYCSGSVDHGFSIKTVILDAVYLLIDGDRRDDLCWRKEFYEEEGKTDDIPEPVEDCDTVNFMDEYYSASVENLQDKIDCDSSSQNLQLYSTFLSDYMDVFSMAIYPYYADQNICRVDFHVKCTQILSSTTSDRPFYSLKRCVSFLAITFLASVIKSEKELGDTFSHYVRQRIRALSFARDNPPPSPSRFALAKACEIKRDEFKSALAKIILESNRSKKCNSELCYYVNNSVLSFIYNYSLEMFGIINDVCNKYKVNCNTLYDLTKNLSSKLDPNFGSIMTPVLNSWEKFRKYFEKYKSEKGEWLCFPDETFHYAAVFVENNIFSELSVDHNKELYDILKYSLDDDDKIRFFNIPETYMEEQSNVWNFNETYMEEQPNVSNVNETYMEELPNVSNVNETCMEEQSNVLNVNETCMEEPSNVLNVDETYMEEQSNVSNVDDGVRMMRELGKLLKRELVQYEISSKSIKDRIINLV